MKPTLLILAAGMGSRYGSLKQIDAVGPSGEAIIDYSIYDAIRAGFEKVSFVIRKNIEEEFREVFDEKLKGRIETEYIYQELDMVPPGTVLSPERVKPWGTAHAVWVAKEFIGEPFAVINADDFYGPSSYRFIADYLSAEGIEDQLKFCMVGYAVQHTLSDFGSVSRGVCESTDGEFLQSIVERTEIFRDGKRIYYVDEGGDHIALSGNELVSMNIWGFTPRIFENLENAFTGFIARNADNLKAELYIPAVINDLIAKELASVKILPAVDQWFGVTYKDDKPLAVKTINRLIREGVYPDNLWD